MIAYAVVCVCLVYFILRVLIDWTDDERKRGWRESCFRSPYAFQIDSAVVDSKRLMRSSPPERRRNNNNNKKDERAYSFLRLIHPPPHPGETENGDVKYYITTQHGQKWRWGTASNDLYRRPLNWLFTHVSLSLRDEDCRCSGPSPPSALSASFSLIMNLFLHENAPRQRQPRAARNSS
jgi:hypothetical protein